MHTAIEESAFGCDAEIFTGYMILVEDSEKTRSSATINMNYFPVMPGFLENESERESKYIPNDKGVFPRIKGVSYLERYDLLCKRLVLKKLYSAAALIVAEETKAGSYRDLSPNTSIKSFLMKLENHCKLIASY